MEVCQAATISPSANRLNRSAKVSIVSPNKDKRLSALKVLERETSEVSVSLLKSSDWVRMMRQSQSISRESIVYPILLVGFFSRRNLEGHRGSR